MWQIHEGDNFHCSAARAPFIWGLVCLGKAQLKARTAATSISLALTVVLQLDFWEGGVGATVEWEGASKETIKDIKI